MSSLIQGFDPFFDGDSRLLILGSFPSVRSRAVNFYYGNPRNDFWRILSSYFGRPVPSDTDKKKEFLTDCKIALWDIVAACRIEGSADSAITDYEIADLGRVLDNCPIERIVLNGGTAYRIFLERYENIGLPYIKLPSTSPANARPKDKEWFDELRRTFG